MLLALLGWSRKADATNTSSYLNIDVTFNASLSVAVDNANTSTYTVTWSGSGNQQLFSPSSATVTNDSGIITERWKLFTNQNTMAASGSVWTLATTTTSVGADQFMVQAVFGSSNTAGAVNGCAAATSSGTYNSLTSAPILTTTFATGLQYTTAGQLASTELQNNGTDLPDSAVNSGSMQGGNKRALCWRVIAPSSTAATQTQVVQVIVAAF